MGGFMAVLPLGLIFLFICLAEAFCIVFFARKKINGQKEIAVLNSKLASQRAEFAAVKNSLKTGIFLMDKDLVIEEDYSKSLEDVLEARNLAGKKFTDFLGYSIKAKDIETLTDYFEMVRTKKFDAAMLEDINPIQELIYCPGEGRAEKTLRCFFVPIERNKGEMLVMGNIENITNEAALQKKIARDEEKRQAEMRSIFEVIQVEPAVFNDFIEDTDYEFDAINSLLKDKNISSKETLIDIYQSIHAIKANAIILELKNFSENVHEVETKIKTLQDKGEITFDDMLRLTIAIEGIMQQKDAFKETVNKIRAFSSSTGRKQNTVVLIEALERVCNKTSIDLGKKVIFEHGEIDPHILDAAPRRVIKEALAQIVRNSVFHGIEMPDVRKKAGKDETGKITLFIQKEIQKETQTEMQNENILNKTQGGIAQLRIRLQDDGKGLDFDKIRLRAEQMHLIKAGDCSVDNNHLLQAIFAPGFSTAEQEGMHAGRGIGLSLARERIKEANGLIKVQTEKGKGTVFTILLPILPPPQSPL